MALRRQNNERYRRAVDIWRHWWRVPIPNPRTKYKVLIFTASIAIGIYAYLRSGGEQLEFTVR